MPAETGTERCSKSCLTSTCMAPFSMHDKLMSNIKKIAIENENRHHSLADKDKMVAFPEKCKAQEEAMRKKVKERKCLKLTVLVCQHSEPEEVP